MALPLFLIFFSIIFGILGMYYIDIQINKLTEQEAALYANTRKSIGWPINILFILWIIGTFFFRNIKYEAILDFGFLFALVMLCAVFFSRLIRSGFPKIVFRKMVMVGFLFFILLFTLFYLNNSR